MRQHQRSTGIAQVTLAGFCFGFLGVLGKWAYSLGLSTGEFLSLRFLTASFLLALFLSVRDPAKLKIGRGAAARCFFLGVFGYAIFSSCYFGALRGLSVSLTVLLLYMYPVWVTAGTRIFFGEKLSTAQLCAMPVALVGLTLLVWGEFSVREPSALALGILSSVFYSAYLLSSRKLTSKVPPQSSALYVMLGAGVTLACIHLRSLPMHAEPWAAVITIAVVGTIFPVSLVLASIQKLTGAELSTLSLVEPCTGVFMGFLVFHETLSVTQFVGAAMILAGMLTVAVAKRS